MRVPSSFCQQEPVKEPDSEKGPFEGGPPNKNPKETKDFNRNPWTLNRAKGSVPTDRLLLAGLHHARKKINFLTFF
jgi:hypothetical protein